METVLEVTREAPTKKTNLLFHSQNSSSQLIIEQNQQFPQPFLD